MTSRNPTWNSEKIMLMLKGWPHEATLRANSACNTKIASCGRHCNIAEVESDSASATLGVTISWNFRRLPHLTETIVRNLACNVASHSKPLINQNQTQGISQLKPSFTSLIETFSSLSGMKGCLIGFRTLF